MNISKVPKPANPMFADKIIVQVQDKLKESLYWLQYSFGKSQKLVKIKDSKEYEYPAIHYKNGEYVSMLPDNKLGNYSFFIIEDPYNIDFRPNAFNNIKLKYSLIFWFNLDTIFKDKDRNIEYIKADIVKILTRDLKLTSGRIDVREIYETSENIFKGFSMREVDSQYLMQPYAGLRFSGELTIQEYCL